MDNSRFKFRVWRIKENCYNHQEPFPTCCMQENGLLAYFHEERQMQNYIVEQCTGLKDKNGKLIYEGDILKSRYSDVMRYEVVYRNAGLCLRVFAIDKPETMDYLHIGEDVESIGLYEVIGNIHEGVNND